MTLDSEVNSTTPVLDAVVLMAGSGSRLRAGEKSLPKPLLPLLGRPLVSYTLEALARAGIKSVYAVVGFEHQLIMERVRPLVPQGLRIQFIHNPEWQKQNGISLLAAADHLSSPFVLTMSDHLFDQSLVNLLLRDARLDQLNLAVDHKLDSIFDLDDATKVQTRGDRIVAIGKHLQSYDAIDTGLFVCPPTVFGYLKQAGREGDCSLTDGVRLMAHDGKARAINIGNAWWQDVDTPEMFQHAADVLAEPNPVAASALSSSSPIAE